MDTLEWIKKVVGYIVDKPFSEKALLAIILLFLSSSVTLGGLLLGLFKWNLINILGFIIAYCLCFVFSWIIFLVGKNIYINRFQKNFELREYETRVLLHETAEAAQRRNQKTKFIDLINSWPENALHCILNAQSSNVFHFALNEGASFIDCGMAGKAQHGFDQKRGISTMHSVHPILFDTDIKDLVKSRLIKLNPNHYNRSNIKWP